MFTAKHVLPGALLPTSAPALILILLLSSIGGSSAAQGLGRPLSENEVKLKSQHVFADGTGLPVGSGDSVEGGLLFREHCAECHGTQGQGGSAIELVGDRSLLATEFPDRGIAVYWPWAPTLFEYVRRSMPPAAPYSLSIDETYAVVAKLLELNGLIDQSQRVDSAFLANIELPNRNGFIEDTD